MKTIDNVRGFPCNWTREGLLRIQVTMREGTFADVKSQAMRNNRTMSMEIRTMVEAAIAASKRLEEEQS